jgi:hypothetical protein
VTGDAVTSAGDAVTTAAGDAVTAAAGDAVAVTGDAITSAGDAVTTAAGDAVAATGDAITTAGDVVAVTGDAITSAGDAVTPVAGDAVTTMAGDAVTTMAGDAVTMAAGDAVASAGDAVIASAGDAVTTAGDAVVTAGGDGITASGDAVAAAAGQTADGPLGGPAEAIAPLAVPITDTNAITDPVAGLEPSVAPVDPVAAALGTGTAGPAGVANVDPAAIGGGPSIARSGVVDGAPQTLPSPARSTLDNVAVTPGHAMALGERTPGTVPVLASPAPASVPGETPGMDPAALSQAHDTTVLQAVAEYSPAARVLVSAAIISSVIGAQAATAGNGGARRLAFTNARLVPCLVKAGVERQIETLSHAVTRGAGAVAGLHGGGMDDTDPTAGHDHSRIQRLLDQVTEGFNDVVDLPPRPDGGESSDGFVDSRLMTQIGMALGFVYLAFLTIWFWATRRSQEGRA